MTNLPYGKEALAKYSKLIKATISGDVIAVKASLEDESIDIQTLIPTEAGKLTSAVALAIDSGSKEMIQAFLNSPQMDYSRSIGEVIIETVFGWSNMEFFVTEMRLRSNVINYALFKENFALAEELIKQGKCSWSGDEIILAAHFYLENGNAQKFMELIVRPNVEMIRNLSKDDRIRLVNLFKYFEVGIDEIFDICFLTIGEDDDFDFWEWFYTFNISEEWFEKLQQKDMLKYLNVVSPKGKTIIMTVAQNSLEKAKIIYDFGADIHLSDKMSLICEAERYVSEFLKLFPFTEDDFVKVFTCSTFADKLYIIEEILKVYPEYKRLITLENVVLKLLQQSSAINFYLCLEYREELGLQADSKIWLEILAQMEIDDYFNIDEYLENVIYDLSADYGPEFESFFEENKGQILHLIIESGDSRFALSFAQVFNIDWNVLDEAGNSAFVKLLIRPQIDGSYLVNNFNLSLIRVQQQNESGAFLHHPELVISDYSLNLIRKHCLEHKIDMFAANKSTSETLLDRVLKEELLDFNTGQALLQSLKSFNKTLSEKEAQMFFTKCPECLFTALENYSTLLPSNIWEIRDQVNGELLVEHALKNGVRPDWQLIIENSEFFYPLMELMTVKMKKFRKGSNVFLEVMQRTASEKFLNLLKKDSIRAKYSDETILNYALQSETDKLLHFALDELGILPNTLLDCHFPLEYLTQQPFSDTKSHFFDYLVQKGAIACIEPVNCAFVNARDSIWIEKLVQLGYELQSSTIRIIKQKLDDKLEEGFYQSPLDVSVYEIITNPRFSRHFTGRDKSICLMCMIRRKDCYERLKNAGADPRCAINPDGESLLHLINPDYFPDQSFFKTFNITEDDLSSKDEASYSPLERILGLYSDDLFECSMLYLYPKLFGFEKLNVTAYSIAKQDTLLGDNSMCIICREDFIETDEVIIGACKHAVHFGCFIQLRSSKCPVCRKPILIQDSLIDESDSVNE